MVFDELADARTAVDVRNDLEQEVRLLQSGLDLRQVGLTVLVSHRAGRHPQRTVIERADERIEFGPQCRLAQLFRKAPELPAAGNRPLIVQEHAVGVAAPATAERHRDDLAALGIVAETIGIRHADELVLDQRFAFVEFERRRNDRSQLRRIGAIGDDQVFAIDETIRSRRIGRVRQRHRERTPHDFTLAHLNSPCDWEEPAGLFATVVLEIERGDAVRTRRAGQHLGMPERAQGIVIAGAPMVLHGQTGKLVVLGVAFVVPRAIDQVDEAVHLVGGSSPEQLDVLLLAQVFRQPAQESRQGTLQPVQALELVGARARAAGVLDLLLARDDFRHVARNLAARAPEVDLKSERVLTGARTRSPTATACWIRGRHPNSVRHRFRRPEIPAAAPRSPGCARAGSCGWLCRNRRNCRSSR